MKTFNFNGRSYDYDDDTIFYLQLGRYDNAYTTIKKFTNVCCDDNFSPHTFAIAAYQKHEVSNGYKKRLVMIDSYDKKIVLAKEISKR